MTQSRMVTRAVTLVLMSLVSSTATSQVVEDAEATPSEAESAAAAPDGNIRWPAQPTSPVPDPQDPTPGNIRWPDPPPGAKTPDARLPSATEGTTAPTAPTAPATAPVAAADAFSQGLAAYMRKADPRRFDEAAALFLSAALQGDRRASMAYGYLQGMGLGAERDRAAARTRLAADAAAGWPRAAYLQSLIDGESRDAASRERAGSLRESAASRGDAAAQNAMGVHYQLAGDRATAEMWFRRAADNGSPSARSNLANLTRSDNAKQAGTTMRKAAGSGDANALFALARRFHRGEGESADYGQALRYYRAAAAKGHASARRMLGLIQSRLGPEGEVDPVWMRQLANADLGDGGNLSAPAPSIHGAAPTLDDPLAGLAALPAR